MKKVFLDIECYSNYFLLYLKSDIKTRSYEMFNAPFCLNCDSWYDNEADFKASYHCSNCCTFELKTKNVERVVKDPLNVEEIKAVMGKYTTVGFNSLNYDLPMLTYALKGASNIQLKQLSDDLITSGKKSWVVCKEYGLYIPKEWDHIDLIEPAPAVMTGLKTYGARMHTPLLQDLPIKPDAIIETNDIELLRAYCINDIDITIELFSRIKKAIELREELNNTQIKGDGFVDYRSKSDAQIAEYSFRSALKLKREVNVVDPSVSFKYKAPPYINFINNDLLKLKNEVETVEFNINEKGTLILNKDVTRKIKIGKATYTIGIGGLHSTEKKLSVTKGADQFLIDIDVISYYPSIIINNKYFPEKLGYDFITQYSNFYKERLKAKLNGDAVKSSVYKIILNGSFGKFGSKYSCLYSPSLLLHTTLTGQLSLLMLIELVEAAACSVISANTDGLTILGDNSNLAELNSAVNYWENLSDFKLERTEYKSIHHESVNTYIAITDDNKVKAKGLYADNGLSKHPIAGVCVRAVTNYIKYGNSVTDTIYDNTNKVTDFISIRNVKGGAVFGDKYLGKTVRWYYSTNGGDIRYLKNNNLVATSSGCNPIMNISDNKIPDDLDYDKYIDIANKMLISLGITCVN